MAAMLRERIATMTAHAAERGAHASALHQPLQQLVAWDAAIQQQAAELAAVGCEVQVTKRWAADAVRHRARAPLRRRGLAQSQRCVCMGLVNYADTATATHGMLNA